METTQKSGNSRIFYMDFLRVISMLAVVLLHTASAKINSVDIGSLNWQVFNFFDSATRWSVPIFVMISGILFLNPQKEISIRTIYKKYIPRLLIILFAWNFLYAIFSCVIDHAFSIQIFFNNILLGPVHMWFLYMIVGLYMLIPFFRKIASDEKLLKYFLLLWFIFSTISTFSDLTGLGILNEIIENKINMHFVIGFSGYFLLGYFLSTKQYKSRYAIIILAICFLITVIGTYFLSIGNNVTNQLLYSNLSPNTIGISIAVFILVKNAFFNKENINTKFKNIVNTFSKYSLGIYVIHFYVLNILSKLNIDVLLLPPVINVVVIFIITVLLSLLATFVLSKIKYIKQLVI